MSDQPESCWVCGYQQSEAGEACPKCGGLMVTATGVRRRGWVMIGMGSFVLALMTGIIVMIALVMLRSGDPGATTRFEGNRLMAVLVFLVLGLAWLFGLAALENGIWLLRHGRRNATLVKVTVWLCLALMAAGAVAQLLE